MKLSTGSIYATRLIAKIPKSKENIPTYLCQVYTM